MQSICVLLAAKNGSKYISEMLNSILLQNFPISEILISVDESNDDTVEVINSVLSGRISYKIISGPNLGSTRNFLFLLEQSKDYDFYALADQDDVWSPRHVSHSVQALESEENLAVACFSPTIGKRESWTSTIQIESFSYQQLLFNNPARGCTIVFNKQARDVLRSFSKPNIRFHDWWTVLVIATYGKVVKINQPSVWYREHPEQQIGTKSGITNFKFKLENFKYSLMESHSMIDEIMEAKLQISTRNREIFRDWGQFKNRQDLNFVLRLYLLLKIKPSSSTKIKTIFGWLYLLIF